MASSQSESDGESFEVDYIIKSRKRGRNMEYLVRWEGYDEDGDSWEPARNLKKSQKVIDAYIEKGLTKTPAKKSAKTTTTTSKRGSTRTTKTVTKMETTQSEASSPESSPVLTRRTVRQEKTQTITTSGAGKSLSRGSGVSNFGGILKLTKYDIPIVILVACLLFIALTFVVEQKRGK